VIQARIESIHHEPHNVPRRLATKIPCLSSTATSSIRQPSIRRSRSACPSDARTSFTPIHANHVPSRGNARTLLCKGYFMQAHLCKDKSTHSFQRSTPISPSWIGHLPSWRTIGSFLSTRPPVQSTSFRYTNAVPSTFLPTQIGLIRKVVDDCLVNPLFLHRHLSLPFIFSPQPFVAHHFRLLSKSLHTQVKSSLLPMSYTHHRTTLSHMTSTPRFSKTYKTITTNSPLKICI
jgi:hypothetical protein